MRSTPLLLAGLLLSLGAVAAETRTVTLEVTKMDCAACPITVREALLKLPGVESVNIDFKTKRAVVAFDTAKTSIEALTRATADAGFPSSAQRVH